MDKTEYISLAKNLMMETLYARSYKSILDQYRDKRNKNHKELSVSSVFYSISEMAMIEALSIRLSRLFDYDDKSANLKYLMQETESHKEYFPVDRGEHTVNHNGREIRFALPLTHTLRECEKCYFKEKVEKEESIQKSVSMIIGLSSKEIIIEVTLDELFKMYHKRLHSLEPIRKRLIEQRKKIYAHNDKEVNFNLEEVYKNNPLSYNDIDTLIEFASDYTAFCYEYTSGKYAAIYIGEIDDWDCTIELVQEGIENRQKTSIY